MQCGTQSLTATEPETLVNPPHITATGEVQKRTSRCGTRKLYNEGKYKRKPTKKTHIYYRQAVLHCIPAVRYKLPSLLSNSLQVGVPYNEHFL
jgi:hypothetical protein